MQSQEQIDLSYYSRWEIASAKQQTAENIAWFAAVLGAVAADLKWDWWLWDIAAAIAIYLICTNGYDKETKKAWRSYENRPVLDDDDYDIYPYPDN